MPRLRRWQPRFHRGFFKETFPDRFILIIFNFSAKDLTIAVFVNTSNNEQCLGYIPTFRSDFEVASIKKDIAHFPFNWSFQEFLDFCIQLFGDSRYFRRGYVFQSKFGDYFLDLSRRNALKVRFCYSEWVRPEDSWVKG
jgi:hypothetical protein